MADDSHIKIGLRVKKSKAFPHGWQHFEAIPLNEPCIIALPGSNADNSKKANGFAKMVQDMLETKNKKLPIYSVEYDLAGRNSVVDREAMLNYFNQGNPNSPLLKQRREEFDYIPNYIHELYHKTFAPRLRDENGNKLPLNRAAQQLNQMMFINHCQGTTVSFQLERLLNEDLERLGYPKEQQDYLLKQVHNIDVAPVIPYGKTKTTTYKFASAADVKVTSVHTPKVDYILRRKKEHERYLEALKGNETERAAGNRPLTMNLSLFRPTANETVFAVNNLYPLEIQKDPDFDGIEHTFDTYSEKEDYVDTDDEIISRTKQGDNLSRMLINTVNWVAANTLKNRDDLHELPDMFKEKRFIPDLKIIMNNRYNFITKETQIIKNRRTAKRMSR